jgi:homoaconitate hydratase family protein/3-isopropylmalate dehydratase small subunit
MGKTIIEKIIGSHAGQPVRPGEIVDMAIDIRIARDFGGANVVKNLEQSSLSIDDPAKTFFTFDCNPGGSSQKYAVNQQLCREFARKKGIGVFDIDAGIGTHIAIDEGLVCPGETLVSTDSHANLMGAISAFGQGMGDQDIAHAFARGKVWFKVPATVKIVIKGVPSPLATPKDVVLAVIRALGANGLLGFASEYYGEYIDQLGLSARITIASMTTEMGGISSFFPPKEEIIKYCKRVSRRDFKPVYADAEAEYAQAAEIEIDGLGPLISKPGHPEDVVPVAEVQGRKIDSAFIGSCTNGRCEDLLLAADILKKRKVAPGVVLKIVPSTDKIWRQALKDGLISIFKEAGALVGNAGCAGCAEGQIGQNGPGEVTVSTGNRNFAGKQGKGDVYLASPATAAASAAAGHITFAADIPEAPSLFATARKMEKPREERAKEYPPKPAKIRGRVWVVDRDNVDTDMIFHNRYLTVTDIKEMGQYAFSNLEGFEGFPRKAKKGEIIVAGKNFGCGSSRQQAVDCFSALGVGMIVAESFGAIYERNAVNSGFPVMAAPDIKKLNLRNGDELEVDFLTGLIEKTSTGETVKASPFSKVQLEIYERGGLLK